MQFLILVKFCLDAMQIYPMAVYFVAVLYICMEQTHPTSIVLQENQVCLVKISITLGSA